MKQKPWGESSHLYISSELGRSLVNVDYDGIFRDSGPPLEVGVAESCHEAAQVVHTTVINVGLSHLHIRTSHIISSPAAWKEAF